MKVQMRNKNKKRINIIDVVVFVALLAIAAAIVYGIFSNIVGSDDRINIRYVLCVDPIDIAFSEKVAEGDGVYDALTVQQIGTVKAVSASQAYHKGTDMQGVSVLSPVEGQCILYITVECEAERTDMGYGINDTYLTVGADYEIRLPNLFCNARCVSIETVK